MVMDKPTGRPSVSVIVPARNEEISLEACLESIVSQHGIAFEVIAVDDSSTDRTREIASSFLPSQTRAAVRVIEAGTLPEGWTGKNNAAAAGSTVARGDWLLFTDADTIHLPGSLVRSLGEARRQGAALLSYSPQQIVEGFSQKSVMPVVFAELAATFRPSQVSDPSSSRAAANGQYILISREAYDSVGGHAAIAGSLLEDVALASAVKRSGRKIFFRYGGDAVRARMYRNFAQLREGWTKNLALLFPSPMRLAVLRALEFVLLLASFAIAIAAVLHARWLPAAFAASIAVALYAFFLKRIRRAHFPWDANLLALFGLPVFSYLLLRSTVFHRRGSVSWKGRNYPGQSAPERIKN
ncbi:MAG: glycosyltransferase family 2 protein [Candidatus Sulfotelmatobacter sp.]